MTLKARSCIALLGIVPTTCPGRQLQSWEAALPQYRLFLLYNRVCQAKLTRQLLSLLLRFVHVVVGKLIPFLRSSVWITTGFAAKYAGPGGTNFNCEVGPEVGP